MEILRRCRVKVGDVYKLKDIGDNYIQITGWDKKYIHYIFLRSRGKTSFPVNSFHKIYIKVTKLEQYLIGVE
jgi:hypothetical protein